MRRSLRLRDGPPLAVWAATGTLLACLLVVAATLAAGAHPELGVRLLLAAAVAAACAAIAGWRVHRLACGLRRLEADALRRLSEPKMPTGTSAPEGHRELRELARTLDALHMRVRVADEIADRHRRTAESASAGMFELLSGLVAAEEGARGQLSAELHDTVAQSLMAARSMLAMDVLDPDEVHRAADLVAEAEDQVRAVMARTRPPALRDGDLARAVATLREDLAHRYGLDVRVHWPTAPQPLPLVTAITVYRFFQEALLNVVKHADVDEADAHLILDGDEVRAVVTDAGPGFDPTQVRPNRGRHVGLGLLGERARLAGGRLEITSWPGRGTTLSLRLPLGAQGARPLAGPRRVTAGGGTETAA